MPGTEAVRTALLAAAWVVVSSAVGCGSTSTNAGGPGAVPVPEGVGASAGTIRDQVVVGWMPGAGQIYEVAWRVGNGSWSALGSTNGVTFQYTVLLGPNVPLGTEVGFRVRTSRDGNWSDWSREATWIRPRGAVIVIPDRSRTGGTVRIRLYSWISALASDNPPLELSAGTHVVAALGSMPAPAEVAWDTTTVPEGTYALSVRLAGGAPATGYWVAGAFTIVVDRSVVATWTVPAYYHLYTKDAVLRFGFSVTPLLYDAPPPPVARLWAGDILVAELGPPPWPTVDWDTTGAPEGEYAIRIELPNYSDPTPPGALDVRNSLKPLVVHLDRTPPSVTCEPPRLGQAVGWIRGRLLMLPDEVVSMSSVTFTEDRSGTDFTSSSSEIYVDQTAWPPRMSVPWGAGAFPPFRVTATAAATDLAGWPASTSCAFDAPAWLAPWGDGPLTAGGEPVVAAAIAFEARLPFDAPNLIQATLGWIPPDGSPSARRMLVARDDGSGFGAPSLLGAAGGWATSAALSARLSSATGRGDPWIAWTEAAAGGKAQPHVARWDGSSWVEDRPAGIGDAARVAREIVLSICAMAEADGVAAWTEVDDAGESSLATRRLVDGSWRDLQGTPGVALPVGGRGPAISTVWGWGNQTIGTPSVLLAFIEAGPAGVPQIRAAEAFPGTGWVAQAAVGNKDSGASASEPTAVWQHEAAVAWVEAWRVLVRETDLFFGGLSFGEPTVLNVDPARRARSPRAARSTPLLQAVNAPGWRAPLTIYFVEEGPGGDEIWARRRHGTTWELLPGPVNAKVPGGVRGLTVVNVGEDTSRSAVAWIDDQGHVHVRVANL